MKSESEKEKGEGRKESKTLAFIVFFFTFTYLLLPFDLLACPSCGDILERGKDAFKAFAFSKGIALSIYFMLAMLYLTVAGTIFFIYRSAKKEKSRKEALERAEKS